MEMSEGVNAPQHQQFAAPPCLLAFATHGSMKDSIRMSELLMDLFPPCLLFFPKLNNVPLLSMSCICR